MTQFSHILAQLTQFTNTCPAHIIKHNPIIIIIIIIVIVIISSLSTSWMKRAMLNWLRKLLHSPATTHHFHPATQTSNSTVTQHFFSKIAFY